jgi:hypothetical protein
MTAPAGMVRGPAGYTDLAESTTPPSGLSTQNVPWFFYDTQSIVSTVTNKLQFFTGSNSDKTLSNFVGANAIPSPKYFSWYSVGFDILVKPQVEADLGPIEDVWEILSHQRATWTFTLSDKKLGPFPVRAAHASGGPTGFMSGTFAAGTMASYANNGTFDGGFVIDNAIEIPPQTDFEFVVEFAAPPTLLTTPVNIVAWLYGTLFRKVS